jgi:fatty acid desaturase
MKTSSAHTKFNSQQFRDSLIDHTQYVSQLRDLLPDYIFKPRGGKLIWLFIHYTLIIVAGLFILQDHNVFLNIFLSILIGHSLGIVGFLGHEINHGSVFRNKKLMLFLGSICSAHWGLYPKAWMNWHNKLHHQHTQDSFRDPDCFGRVQYYRYSKKLQKMEQFLPGSGSLLSYTFLFWYFSFHTIYIVWFNPYVFNKKSERRESRFFMIAVYSVWLAFSIWIHPLGVVFFLFI